MHHSPAGRGGAGPAALPKNDGWAGFGGGSPPELDLGDGAAGVSRRGLPDNPDQGRVSSPGASSPPAQTSAQTSPSHKQKAVLEPGPASHPTPSPGHAAAGESTAAPDAAPLAASGTASGQQQPPRTADDDADLAPREATPSQAPQADGTRKSVKKTKAALRIATENIRGRGSSRPGGSYKWKKLADDMRVQKIGLMAVQETHTDGPYVDALHLLYSHLQIFNSPDPNNPSGAGGVAIVLNKFLTNARDVDFRVLIPGRAISVRFEWHAGAHLTVAAVYAPTEKTANHEMWADLTRIMRSDDGGHGWPDILLGDFNFVEDGIDRFPAKRNPIDAPDSFDGLKAGARLKDAWRSTFPDTTEWTWRNAARTTMSRIDRIYMRTEQITAAREWVTSISGITRNDHSRVQVDVVKTGAPESGSGRWAMPEFLTRDAEFMGRVDKFGAAAEAAMRASQGDARAPQNNPQWHWMVFKSAVRKEARRRARQINCKREHLIVQNEKERETLVTSLGEAGEQPGRDILVARLRQVESTIFALKEVEKIRIFRNRATKRVLDAEGMSKAWFSWARAHRPRELMPALAIPETQPTRYVSTSQEMAELARDYHCELQTADNDADPLERENAIETVLANVSSILSPKQAEALDQGVPEASLERAVVGAKNGSAPGLDGLIYELWKEMRRRHARASKDKTKPMNVVSCMLLLFKDIEDHGVLPDSGFADGWLCPLYKKGDRSWVENYRPITLLNTDYKLMTKSLAIQLAEVAPIVIHHTQAGFVRGRSITDQTKLTSLILDYAEASEQNGMIVALDQEKAYDKIKHDYLLRTLRAFGVPERFIRLVRTLYEGATTAVIVNGCMSSTYSVTRGVRQGDPLSCLVFNLAIEPLAAALRRSGLEGYSIPGAPERLIATLYADDTTVYLSERDSFGALLRILEEWCLASGARFNVKKTEIIPLGTPAFRAGLADGRLLRPGDVPLPDHVRIARDGEVTRILGAWPGNGTENVSAWSTVLDKIRERLARWERMRPSVIGRSLISQAIIGGCSQYLTAAQGMPTDVERKLEKITLDFFWGNAKRHPINMETLCMRPEDGGMNLFCVKDRNNAQYMAWLGAFLLPSDRRPLWAFVLDQLYARATIQKHRSRIPEAARTNPIWQDWRPNQRRLPLIARRITAAARLFQVVPDAPCIPQETRESVPVWSHPALLSSTLLHDGRANFRCLRTRHAVGTVEDLEEIAELDEPDHEDASDCACDNCVDDRLEGCKDPAGCQGLAGHILSQISSKWNPATATPDRPLDLWDAFEDSRTSALQAGELLVVDVREPERAPVETLCRAFVGSLGITPAPAAQVVRRPAGEVTPAPPGADAVVAFAFGAMHKDGTEDARGGFDVHFPDNPERDIYAASPPGPQSFTASSVYALAAAAWTADRSAPLHLISTSKFAVEAVTLRRVANEASGWGDKPDLAHPFRLAMAAFRARGAETTVTYVSRKRARLWAEVRDAKKRALTAAELAGEYVFDEEAMALFDRPGMDAAGVTQRQVHEAIRQSRRANIPQRRVTAANIAAIKTAAKEEFGRSPSTRQIWAGLRRQEVSKGARVFLWKAIHGAHKVGEYFSKMPEPWKEKGLCPDCGVLETMEHILFECTHSGRAEVWRLAHIFLRHKRLPVVLNYGLTLGCAAVMASPNQGWDRAATRAYTLVVSESAFLIWKLRCERRIGHAEDPNWELTVPLVRERWMAMLRTRVARDKRLTNVRRYGTRAYDHVLVRDTWRDSIDPMADWVTWRDNQGTFKLSFVSSFLVGRGWKALGVG